MRRTCPPARRFRGPAFDLWCDMARGCRQANAECRAFTRIRIDLDRAAMRPNDLRNGQTKPGTLLLRREIRIEDPIQHVRGNAAAAVLHRQAHVAPGRESCIRGSVSAVSSTFCSDTSTTPPRGIACIAFRTRLCTTWAIWFVSTSAGHAPSGIRIAAPLVSR